MRAVVYVLPFIAIMDEKKKMRRFVINYYYKDTDFFIDQMHLTDRKTEILAGKAKLLDEAFGFLNIGIYLHYFYHRIGLQHNYYFTYLEKLYFVITQGSFKSPELPSL
jgi:hypothetical protein